MITKIYKENLNERSEIDLNTLLIMVDERSAGNIVYISTSIKGLLDTIAELENKIMTLKDQIEEDGKRVCEVCGSIKNEEEMRWSDRERGYVCKECEEED